MNFCEILKKDTMPLHWTEKMGLFNLSMSLMLIPIDSGISLIFACLWMVSVVLKNMFLRRWSFFTWHQDKTYNNYNNNYYVLIPMMVYWLCYLLSMLWTQNKETGWAEMGSLIWFLILPLTYCCTDFREVKKIHIRTMSWLFVLLMSVLFVVLFANVMVKTLRSEEHSFLWFMMNQAFYSMHHAYIALYLVVGLCFLYDERKKWSQMRGMGKTLWVFCALCMTLFVFCVNSRAGVLGLILLLAMAWLHQLFFKKRYRFAIISFVALASMVVVVHFSLPEHFRRLSDTAQQVANGDTTDGRFNIMNRSWKVIKENLLFGVGAGDSLDELAPYYVSEEGVQRDALHSHNQYLDAWLSTGLMGLLSLFALLSLPLAEAWKKKQAFVFMFVVILSVNLLFESMFERQMGVPFVAVMYVLCAMMLTMDSSEDLLVMNEEKS